MLTCRPSCLNHHYNVALMTPHEICSYKKHYLIIKGYSKSIFILISRDLVPSYNEGLSYNMNILFSDIKRTVIFSVCISLDMIFIVDIQIRI